MINEKILDYVDGISQLAGKFVWWFPLIGGGLLCVEVVARYVFSSPIDWVPLVSSEILAVFYFLVGAYTLHFKGHVAMDIFSNKLSKKRQAVLEICTFLFFILFFGVLLWTSFEEAVFSVKILETTPPPWLGPLWPVKVFMVLGVFLVVLQGISNLCRNINVVFKTGEL